MVPLLTDDHAVAHVHEAVTALADARVMRNQHEGLSLLRVQLLHQRDDVVGGKARKAGEASQEVIGIAVTVSAANAPEQASMLVNR